MRQHRGIGAIWIGALIGLVLLQPPVWAWGGEGHRIIALIAADKLTTAARAGVSGLLGGDARVAMEDVSTWADEIKADRPETRPWHYVNIEISTNGYETARDCDSGNCVVAQVERDVRVLEDRQLTKAIRGQALRFLIHFVGDLHQPLHCADNHDRGGNEVRVMLDGRNTNLHAVWDTDVVVALGHYPDQVARMLETQITAEETKAWSQGSPADWANETFEIAKRDIYSALPGDGATAGPIILPQNYAARARSITAIQLERAGVRLAGVLNRAFDSQVNIGGPTIVPPGDASSHAGQIVTIKGIVDGVLTAPRSGVTFIDMGGRYPDNAFTVVIFREDAAKFPTVDSLTGNVIEITGRVRFYKGKPEIILRAANQLNVMQKRRGNE